MTMHTFLRRWGTGSLASVQAESAARALELVARSGSSLAYIDLTGFQGPRCFLPEVDLRGADLESSNFLGSYLPSADFRTARLVNCNLNGATLRKADFRSADLRGVDLRGADLRGAQFQEADLRGACITGARLDSARLDWRSSVFAVEILRRDPGCRGDALSTVVELAFEQDERPYAWLRTLFREPCVTVWAASILGPVIDPDDDAPEILQRLAFDSNPKKSRRIPTTVERPGGSYWTRAAHSRQTRTNLQGRAS